MNTSNTEHGSKDVAAAAVEVAVTMDRAAEEAVKKKYNECGIGVAAVNFGSDFQSAVAKILERAVVAAKREGIIDETHAEEGAVAGAAHEALTQITVKAVGLNLGGKIGVARHGAHISVCIFCAIGLLNLNEVAIGLGHRAV